MFCVCWFVGCVVYVVLLGYCVCDDVYWYVWLCVVEYVVDGFVDCGCGNVVFWYCCCVVWVVCMVLWYVVDDVCYCDVVYVVELCVGGDVVDLLYVV